MDYCKGGELNTYLKEKKFLSEKESKNIFKQIYNAVKYIHSQNIIHRDLKLNNILFKDEDKKNIVLIDFGISGYKNGKNYDKIKAGTFRFVPPEILEGNFESNTKLDIWSMGLILYKMIYGIYPFEGKNDEEIGKKILNEKINFNVYYNDDGKRKKIICSREVKDLLNGMLEKNYLFRIDDDCDLFEKWFDANDDEKFIKTVNSVKNNNYNNPFEIENKSKKYKKNAYLNPSLHNKIININRLKMIKNNNNFGDNNFINVKKKSSIDENSNKKIFLPIINNNNIIIKKFNNQKKEKLKFLNKCNSLSKIKILNKNKLNEIYNNNNNFDIKTKLKKLNFRNKSKKSLFSTNQLLN
jgi:serine/threonine protein kinase